MPKPLIYLAGPIAGENRSVTSGKHVTLAEYFGQFGIEVLSPLRSHAYITQGVPVQRDLLDIRRADLVFATLGHQGEYDVSIGTCIELGYAVALNKPVVAYVPASGRYAQHEFILELCHTYNQLPQAMAAAVEMLSSGAPEA